MPLNMDVLFGHLDVRCHCSDQTNGGNTWQFDSTFGSIEDRAVEKQFSCTFMFYFEGPGNQKLLVRNF